jgi:predicted membrane-bound spermidine synthase
MTPTRTRWPAIYLGVALTTLAALLLELALTRIFSVVFYYHFAFLAISIALFGLGAGGVFSYVVAAWRGNFFTKLGLLAALNSLLVIGSLVYLLTRKDELGYGTLALVYFASALPFFVTGTVVSLLVAETIERVNRVYFFDLLGAAAGCLLLIPLLDFIGGPNTVIAAAVMYAASAVVWFHLAGRKRTRASALGLTLATLLLLIWNSGNSPIDIRYAKGKTLKQEHFVKWNSFSRIAVTGQEGSGMIFIDADASTGIPYFDFDRLSEKDRKELLYKGPGLPYVLRPGAKTLVIGVGGGWDLARALASGSRDVTGVEINPIIATTVMRERFPHYSLRLFERPEVHIVVEDGRSFVRRTREEYQVLQATLVDTWASTAAGAFALSENNLYTTEAFCEYLNHLSEDGLLVFTRWGFEPPRESLRLIALASAALRRLGETQPWRHVAVVREGSDEDLAKWGATDTVLISRKPFSASDLARLRFAITQGPFRPVYLPDEQIPNPFTQMLRSGNVAQFQRQYRYDVSPVNDNRPFFFYTVQPHDLWAFLRSASRLSADYQINKAVPLLFGLMLVSVLATGVVLALPRLLLGSRLPRQRGVLRLLWYFIFIGAGYIMIQVALVQKFVLFLGHPTYALTVIIFSMLIWSGIGSYFSQRIAAGSEARLTVVLALVAGLVASLSLLVSPLLEAGVGWPLWFRFAASVVLIAPLGFLMGVPFPTGLRRLEERQKAAVRWAWSVNAAASVMGSVGAIVLAIYLGLRETLLIGAAMYLCALATLRLAGAGIASSPEISAPARM